MTRLVSGLLAPCFLIAGLLAGAVSAETHPYDQIRLGIGDFADAGSTAYGLAQPGIAEVNPILAPFGDGAPVVGLGVKYGLKKLIVANGRTPARANVSVETVSMVGFCNNIAIVAGAHPARALAFGVICGAVTKNQMTKKYERETGRTLDGKPIYGTALNHAPREITIPPIDHSLGRAEVTIDHITGTATVRQGGKITGKTQATPLKPGKPERQADRGGEKAVSLPKTDPAKGRPDILIDTMSGEVTVSQQGKVVGKVSYVESYRGPDQPKRQDLTDKDRKAAHERIASSKGGKRAVKQGEEPRYEVFLTSSPP